MRPDTKSRSRDHQLVFESLESRCLLAGNVHVLVNDAILLVVGDAADNQVEISQNAAGQYVVTGVDTTINQGTGSFVSGGVTHITVSMENGDDQVTVNGVNVASNFSFYGGAGNDRLTTSGLSARHFHAEGNQGNDVFETGFSIRKSAYFYLGAGDDIVSSGNMFVGRNLKIFGHGGDDTVSSSTLTVGRKLEFHMDDGNDSVLMSGATSVRRFARIDLGAGNDFAGVLPTRDGGGATFRQSLSIDTGDGNDNLALDAGVAVNGTLRTRGGDGTDALQQAGSRDRARIGEFENFQVPNLNALIDTVFTRLQDAGIGIDVPDLPLVAGASSSPLLFTENSNPVLADSAFGVTGTDSVTGAVIQIRDFVAGQESLTFNNTGSISGTFDSSTGTLTLTGQASSASYQAAIRSIRYQNTSDDPLTDLRQLEFRITTDDETVNVSRELQVVAVNDAPVILPDIANQTVLPDDLPVVVDDLLTVSDADHSNLVSAVVQIVSGFVAGEGVLAHQPVSGITSSYDATTGTLTLTGDVSVADWQTVLRSVTYTNEAADPTAGPRTIRMTVNDGEATASADFQVNLQEAVQPNRFEVSQDAANGTVVGQVTTSGAFQTPVVFQFADDQLADELLLNPDDHFSDALTAPVILIEYLDFQCPGCAAYHPIVEQMEATFGDDLLVVSRHFPLESIHPNARAAAVASEAANRQGMFEAMASQLFANQDEWKDVADPTSLFEGYATSIGLDLDQFRTDLADPDLDARVTRDLNDANELGLPGTPAFILQGAPISNPASQSDFDGLIQAALDDLTDPFVINRETGEIVLRDNSLLNSSNSPITLSVLVEDSFGNTETVDVTIDVTN